jgi:hypothetical protein
MSDIFGNSPQAAITSLDRAIELLKRDGIEEAKNALRNTKSHLQAVQDIAQEKINENVGVASMIMSSMYYQIGFTTKHIGVINNCLATLPARKAHIIKVLEGKEQFTDL